MGGIPRAILGVNALNYVRNHFYLRQPHMTGENALNNVTK